MNKLQTRKQFIKQAMDDTEEAVEQVKDFARRLKKCQKKSDKVRLLSKHLHVSTRTVWGDWMKD